MGTSPAGPDVAAQGPAGPEAAPARVLDVRGVTLTFGGVHALEQVDLSVDDRVICGLVGPNGAGKTSLFNCINGYYRPSAGSVHVLGVDALAVAPHRLADLGVARTFQHPVLQLDDTVLDNVLVGAHTALRGDPLSYALRLPHVRRREQEARNRALHLLEQLSLGPVADLPASDLPYGSLKRIEIARALMTGPRLLLLDEPAAGLTHDEVRALGDVIAGVRSDFGLAVLVVEHHMGLISAITDKVVALVEGRKVAEGTAAQVQAHPVVVQAYLGAPGGPVPA